MFVFSTLTLSKLLVFKSAFTGNNYNSRCLIEFCEDQMK